MKKQSLAIYNPYLDTKGGGEKVALAMAEFLSKDYDVTLVSRKKVDLAELGSYFNLDLSKCRSYVLPDPSGLMIKLSRRLHFPGRLKNFIHERKDYKRLKAKNYDIFVNNCYKSAMPCPAPKGIYMCMFPQEFLDKSGFSLPKKLYHSAMEVLEKLFYGKTGHAIIDTYSLVTVNSKYTLSWMEKLWGSKEAEILYPICEDMHMDGVPKEKIILNVGRFFANSGENHYKCQDKLIEAFKELPDLHKKGWELHFAGSVAEDIDSLKYMLKLIKSAAGFPIYFHMNVPFAELKELFNNASIYWHATGWGSDASIHPEKQEHFGISTVEAKSAGAVPVVINSAGQKETITQGEDGYLWNNKEQLLSFTKQIASNSTSRSALSKRVVTSARQFNKISFEKTLSAIMKVVLLDFREIKLPAMKPSTLKNKRILITQYALAEFAGSEVVTLELVRYFVSQGAHVTIYTLWFDDPIATYFRSLPAQSVTIIARSDAILSFTAFDYIWVHHHILPASMVEELPKLSALPVVIFNHMSSYIPIEQPYLFKLEASTASVALFNSPETLNNLEGYLDPVVRKMSLVFPNPAPVEFVEFPNPSPERENLSPKSILVVSNHPPEEVLKAVSLLKERGTNVSITGVDYMQQLVTPDILADYDVVVTIGKTVQYCLVMGKPVYCYDRFGGPGYLTARNLEDAAFYNFSGRGKFRKRSPTEIVDDITKGYSTARSFHAKMRDKFRERYNLALHIQKVLNIKPRKYQKIIGYQAKSYVAAQALVVQLINAKLLAQRELSELSGRTKALKSELDSTIRALHSLKKRRLIHAVLLAYDLLDRIKAAFRQRRPS
jgi:glycosyltransferase involved in cell wall biosynthesis